jgi:ribosome-binding factor A
MITSELSDPRIGQASVTEVHVSPDYRHAHVRLSLGGSVEEQSNTLAGVEHAKHFLRSQLTDRLQLHKTPELHFDADMPAKLGAKAPQILRRIRRGRPKPEKEEENTAS